MKLWVKSSVGLGVVGLVTGVAIGGIGIFHITHGEGNPFSTSKTTNNHFPSNFKKSLSELTAEDLNAFFVKSSSDISVPFATFDVKDDNNAVEYKGKKVTFEAFNNAFIKKFNTSPVQVVTFGPAIFKNEYLDAVGPKEFCEYVAWFLKNVSWGSDLAALEDFSIMRGIQTAGNAIVLGEHVNTNNEKTTIQFYPDGFFGSLPAYSQEAGAGQQMDNLLAKLSDLDNTLLTKSDIEQLVAKKQEIQAASNANDFRIRSIVPIQEINEPNDPERNGQMGYEVYIDIYPGLIDDVLAIYPYLGKQLNGLHIERSSDVHVDSVTGDIYRDDKLVDGPYWGIDPNSRIPFLAVLKAANPDFKGVGINWLKYVGQHEYGHHTTLQSLQDGSENGVYAGASSEQKPLVSGKYYSLDVINKYLSARAHNILATASTTDSENGIKQFLKFVENGVQEDENDVYGSWYQGNITQAIEDPWRRGSRASLTELAKVAAARGISLSDLTIENAWDLNSATINPGFEGSSYVYSRESSAPAGKIELKKLSDTYNAAVKNDGGFLKDANDRIIEYNDAHQQFILQYWANEDGTASSEPVFYQFDTGNAGMLLNYARPNTQMIYDKSGAPITNWSSSTPRVTVVKDAKGLPIVEDSASLNAVYAQEQAIESFLANYAWNYTIGGWESSGTLASGFRISPQIYANGNPISAQEAQYQDAKKFASDGRKGLIRWFIYREQKFFAQSQDNVNYFAPDLTGTVNDELAAFGQYLFIISKQGIGYGAWDSLGSFLKANGAYYSALPSGRYEPFGHKSDSRSDTAWLSITQQDSSITPNAKYGMFKIYEQGNPDHALVRSAGNDINDDVYVLYSLKDQKEVGASFKANDLKNQPQLKMIFTGETLNEADNTFQDLIKNDPYYKYVFDNKIPHYKKIDSSMWNSELLKYTQESENLTFQKYVEKMSLNPLTDFKYSDSTLEGNNGATVIKIDALKRIFDIAKIKAANPGIEDSEIEVMMTGVMTLKNIFFIKDDLVSISDLQDSSKNESIKALLLGGRDGESATKSFISENATLRKWFTNQPKATDDKTWNDLIQTLADLKTNWNSNDPTLKIDDKKLSYNEIALLTGIWRWNPTTNDSKHDQQDFGLALTVGPTSDIKNQLMSRNEDKLDDVFSDYTFNIAEMTNRDYLQITYMPSFENLENTPNWFTGSSEAKSGQEYAIDSSATKVYLSGSLFGLQSLNAYTALQTAIQSVFHFKLNDFGDVEAEIDDAKGQQYPLPSKGIIAASNLNNWKNYVQPIFLGKPVASSNGYFKDDAIRRGVGNDIYINGDWKYSIIGDEIYESNAAGNKFTKSNPPKAIGKYYSDSNVVTNDKGVILIKFENGVLAPTAEAKNLYGWDSVDVLTGQILDAQQKVIAGLDQSNHTANDLNQNTIGYITNDVITLSDPSKAIWKIVDRKIYEYRAGFDYTDESQLNPSQNPSAPALVADIRGYEIYDLDGKPIKDTTIKIKDIYGKDVTDRANAVWQFLLQEKGIGDGLQFIENNGVKKITNSGRNIEGIWRSPSRDALYLWGYIPKEMEVNGNKVTADSVKYLSFTDVNTGDKKYLPVAIGQDNLFYYKDRGQNDAQGNPGIKQTIADEGFTSWTSDFAAMGGYRDGLLLSDHQYSISLVDENYNEVMPISLGSRTVIAENGKPEGKAPNVIKQENGQAVIYVKNQFND